MAATKKAPAYISPLHVDDREDRTTPYSKEPFSAKLNLLGVPTKTERLEFADFFWYGRFDDDHPMISIGVERKALTDLLSCMVDGRLTAHQIPGLKAAFDVRTILIEGVWRANPKTGLVQRLGGKGNGGESAGHRMKWSTKGEDRGPAGWTDLCLNGKTFNAAGLENYIRSLRIKSGIPLAFTRSRQDTVAWLAEEWRWWQKGWDKHHSVGVLEKPLAKGMGSGQQGAGWVVEGREVESQHVPLVARVAAQLPGIGIGKALAAAKVFGSVEEMISAPPVMWRLVPGVGEILAEGVVREIKKIHGNGKKKGKV